MIKNVYGKEIKGCEFAGFFYPKNKEELNKLLDDYFNIKETFDIKGEILGIISPHAGYIYSGKVSAYSYKILENRKFDTILILGPSHHYLFKGLSIYPNGYFDTPFGMLEVDEDIAKEFKELDFVNYERRYF
ncbi:MAG: AmmeMemoRadiSam system protein B, partial [Candidatus Aenigmatarchaeota archaeon]